MMMNALSQVSKDTDIGKQMAYMRNYINQLRDEIENDLMNIGYNNLDADLRKRFDDMQTGLLTANNTSLEVAGMLKTQYLKADEIVSKYATITSLNAVSARVGYIESDYVKTASITALSGEINDLTTTKLDATTAYIDFMEVTNWVRAGYIKAEKIKTQDLFTDTLQASLSLWSNLITTNAINITGGSHFGYSLSGSYTTVTSTGGQTVKVPIAIPNGGA